MEAPERIVGVSMSMFSIARHFGGITFQGRDYIYDPTTDTLIRDDVLKREKKAAKKAKPATPATAEE